ncbi:DUF320 domain-containing protein [Pseudarthrobacter equi]|uniref:chaplin family protein n=1 Tax=Pseudarthrobacter equi TaxID=728066 RepID=UPI0021C1CC9C|nr:chaplin family protein [Pseudarthrobacter equi]MCT9623987.1 DUF320 domain-containing protein [Pseudarthrobacter equi]
MTHRNIRRCLLGTAFAGGLLAFGGVAANASDTTSGTDGLLSGTQVVAPINIPINLGATSVGLLGDSTASTQSAGTGAPAAAPAQAPGAATGGADGVASGTQVIAPITVPVNVGATSLGLVGDSAATTETVGAPAPAPAVAPAASTDGNNVIASGTQIVAPVTIPITVGATSAGVIGDSAAGIQNPAAAAPSQAPASSAPSEVSTSGDDSVASGTQIVAPVTAPINLGATSAGILGDSAAAVESPGATGSAPAGGQAPATTSGAEGVLSGTQVIAPVTAPISLGATSLGLVGDSAAAAEGSGPAGTTTAPAAPITTTGADGILSGTQIVTPITLPISLGATSVGVIGDSTASVVAPPAVTPPVVTPPVVTPPVVTPPVVTPPVVTPPVVTPPVATPPAVTTPAVNPPATAVQPAAVSAETRTPAAAQAAIGSSSAPMALAHTGANTGLLVTGMLLLAFGGPVMLGLRRKRA